MTEPAPKDDGYRSFALFLGDLCDGEANRELTDVLEDLMTLMRERADVLPGNKVKGSITLKLDLSVDDRGVVNCNYDVKHKDPAKPKKSAGVYWLTRDGKISPRNPKQQDLFLREVEPRAVLEVPSITTAAKEV